MTTVNVLEVMDECVGQLRWATTSLHTDMSAEASALEEARAAVAELIEASKVSSALMHAMLDALDDDEFGEGDGKVLDRLNTALSRIGGGA